MIRVPELKRNAKKGKRFQIQWNTEEREETVWAAQIRLLAEVGRVFTKWTTSNYICIDSLVPENTQKHFRKDVALTGFFRVGSLVSLTSYRLKHGRRPSETTMVLLKWNRKNQNLTEKSATKYIKSIVRPVLRTTGETDALRCLYYNNTRVHQ